MGKKLGNDPRRVADGGIQGSAEAREGLTIHAASSTFRRPAVIDLFDRPVEDRQILENSPDIRYTKFCYSIKFQPASTDTHNRFVINADIVSKTEKIRVGSFDHLQQLAKSNPALAWLLRNTNLNNDLFKVALSNINIRIPICIDIPEYLRKIGDSRLDSRVSTAQAEDQNKIRLDNVHMAKIIRSQAARRRRG